MKWEKFIQGMHVGGNPVEVRSMRIQDPLGAWRRYRVCSAAEPAAGFTKKPALARLLRDKNGRAGVLVKPRGTGFVKVGANAGMHPVVMAPIGALSKKPRSKLLRQAGLPAVEHDDGLWFEAHE